MRSRVSVQYSIVRSNCISYQIIYKCLLQLFTELLQIRRRALVTLSQRVMYLYKAELYWAV